MPPYLVPAAAPLTSVQPVAEGDLAGLIAAGARHEGCTDVLQPGVRYSRYSMPSTFLKTEVPGPLLIVIAQGRKVVRWGKDELDFDPGRYLVITGEGAFAGRVLDATPAKPYLAVAITIPSELVAKTLFALADASQPPSDEEAPAEMPAFVAPLDPVIKGGVLRLLKAVLDPIERQIVAPLVLEELVYRLLRGEAAALVRSAVGHSQDAGQIHKAMRFMRANATAALSVEAVARHVAMSPSHFAHRFRAVARVSPMRFLKQLRMDRGRALMIAQGARVGEAAAQIGYASVSHFSRDFKQTFGTTPAEYVRRYRRP